jgi:hypothetical protein
MTKDEALDLALEFFETMQRYKGTRSNIFIKFEPTATGDYVDLCEFDEKAKPIITAIKQARSAPYVASPRVQSAERGEPVAWGCNRYIEDDNGFQIGTDEPELAWGKYAPDDNGWWPLYTTPPAQPVQEPVADAIARYLRVCSSGGMPKKLQESVQNLVYDAERLGYFKASTPPAAQRQWVGLTDEEINAFFEGMEPNNGFWLSFARAIEAKLKELNT